MRKVQDNTAKNTETEQAAFPQKSRRDLLLKGLGIATSVVGAGALLEAGSVNAFAHTNSPNDNVGNFSSSNSQIAAVNAGGTNGAPGVNAQSDSGIAVYGASSINNSGSGAITAVNKSSGLALYAVAGSGTAISANGGTNGDGVYGTTDATNTFNGVHGVSNANGGSGVRGEHQSNGTGVSGFSVSGTGVSGESTSGPGVAASSTSGTALLVIGTIAVQGNAVGKATLPAGQKSVKVTTPAASTNSNVILTALNKYKGSVWVTQATGSFTINISATQTSAVNFTYLLIN